MKIISFFFFFLFFYSNIAYSESKWITKKNKDHLNVSMDNFEFTDWMINKAYK